MCLVSRQWQRCLYGFSDAWTTISIGYRRSSGRHTLTLPTIVQSRLARSSGRDLNINVVMEPSNSPQRLASDITSLMDVVLSQPSRLRSLSILCSIACELSDWAGSQDSGCCVHTLVEALDLSQATNLHHLSIWDPSANPFNQTATTCRYGWANVIVAPVSALSSIRLDYRFDQVLQGQIQLPLSEVSFNNLIRLELSPAWELVTFRQPSNFHIW